MVQQHHTTSKHDNFIAFTSFMQNLCVPYGTPSGELFKVKRSRLRSSLILDGIFGANV